MVKKDNWVLRSDQGDVSRIVESIRKNEIVECDTDVEVDFFGFDFKTSCPGIPHLVKFAYHDSWKTSTADSLSLISPGLIAFIPSEADIRFDFGRKLSWSLSAWISLTSIFALFGVGRFRKSWLELRRD